MNLYKSNCNIDFGVINSFQSISDITFDNILSLVKKTKSDIYFDGFRFNYCHTTGDGEMIYKLNAALGCFVSLDYLHCGVNKEIMDNALNVRGFVSKLWNDPDSKEVLQYSIADDIAVFCYYDITNDIRKIRINDPVLLRGKIYRMRKLPPRHIQ